MTALAIDILFTSEMAISSRYVSLEVLLVSVACKIYLYFNLLFFYAWSLYALGFLFFNILEHLMFSLWLYS